MPELEQPAPAPRDTPERRPLKGAAALAGLVAVQALFGDKALERGDEYLKAKAAAADPYSVSMPDAPDALKTGPFGVLAKPYMVMRLAFDYFVIDDLLSMASMLAFTLMLALFPFLIFMTAFAAMWGGQDLAEVISSSMFDAFPDEIAAALQPEVESVLGAQAGGGGLLTFGLAIMLFSLTGAVEAARAGLNRAYGLIDMRSVLRTRFESLLFVLAGSVVLVLVALLAVVVPILYRFVAPYVPEILAWANIINTVRIVVLALVLFGLVLALHRWLPARRLRIRLLWIGVVFTLGVWYLLGVGFSWYLAYFGGYTSTYAGLAGIMAGMMFFYLASVVLLFGGEINRAVYDLRQEGWPGLK